MSTDKKPMMFSRNDPTQTYYESISVNTLFKLDRVLEFLHDDKPPGKTSMEVSNYLQEKYDTELGEHNAYLALQKLRKEGYADSEESTFISGAVTHTKLVFYITFDGVRLYRNGGYTKKEQDDNFQKTLAIRLQKQIVILTVILAFGTLVMALMEVLSYFFPKK